MESSVAVLLSDRVLNQACHCFAIEPLTITLLGDVENYVFQGISRGHHVILRITHSSHRQEADLLAELEFLDYLLQAGCDVARPIYSEFLHLVEAIELEDGSTFFVTAFDRARGRMIDPQNPREFSDTLFRVWGHALSKMHHYARIMPQPTYKRSPWYEGEYFCLEDSDLGQEDPQLFSVCSEKITELRQKFLLEESSRIGLIHSDLHPGNFCYHEDGITVFDFDDCRLDWFANDIAVVLHSVLRIKSQDAENDLTKFARHFFMTFMEGYRCFSGPEEHWAELIPDLIKLRQIFLFQLYRRKFAEEQLGSMERDFLKLRREQILSDTLPFDVSQLFQG